MPRNRRLACLILGVWLGGAVCADLLVSRNFSTIDRFIAAPASAGATAQIRQAGTAGVRFILRRNAAEENAWILERWEWFQILIAAPLFLLILFEQGPPRSALVLILIMLAIVLLQGFLLTPNIASLGREVDEIPVREQLNNPTVSQFRAFQGIHSGCEILKLAAGLILASRLLARRGNRLQKANETGTGARLPARKPTRAPEREPDPKHG